MAYQIDDFNETNLAVLTREQLVADRRKLGRDWTIANRELKLAKARHNDSEIAKLEEEIAMLEPKMHALSKRIGDIDRAAEKEKGVRQC